MTTIVTALGAEAAPIIEKYHLKKEDNPFFPLYSREHIRLIVSGMTPIRSAVATTYLLATAKEMPRHVVNIGISASLRMEDPIGTCYAIRKITDTMTDKVYHLPKRRVAIAQTAIATYPSSQQSNIEKHHLVDMESSGFYVAAATMLPSEKIWLFKMVSDHGSSDIPEPAFVKKIIAQNLPAIARELGI